jgi:hypothetical protein
MIDLGRPPRKSERVLSTILSAITSIIFGGVAALGLNSNPILLPTVIFYSLLFLISITVFFRSAFTPNRSLSLKGKIGLARALVIVGSIGVLLVLLQVGSIEHRLFILGPSLGLIGYGLANINRRSR